MANKTNTLTCAEHGEYFVDALGSPCPECQEVPQKEYTVYWSCPFYADNYIQAVQLVIDLWKDSTHTATYFRVVREDGKEWFEDFEEVLER